MDNRKESCKSCKSCQRSSWTPAHRQRLVNDLRNRGLVIWKAWRWMASLTCGWRTSSSAWPGMPSEQGPSWSPRRWQVLVEHKADVCIWQCSLAVT